MSVEPLQFLSAILLASERPKALADFYRDKLGVPLQDEQHGDSELHWGCTLGDLHFAIHPMGDFPEDAQGGVGAIKLAFTVFDMDSYVAELARRGVELVYEPRDLGWCRMTALRDPDGNYIELTQLSADWFSHLEDRRAKGIDVIARWRAAELGEPGRGH